MRLGLKPDGRFALFQGAVDIGQGSNTVIAQICAEALGAPIALLDLVSADTDLTPDCGKTSASRQTFVSGNAARPGRARDARRDPAARQCRRGGGDRLRARRGRHHGRGRRTADRSRRNCPSTPRGFVVEVEETFDPPTTPLDENGQGEPYAVFGSGAHIAEVEVDIELGRVRVLRSRLRARCRPRDQSDAGRRPDRGRRGAGARPRADGGVLPRQGREPARLSDPDHRRHAAGRVHPDRGRRPRSARSAPRASANRR